MEPRLKSASFYFSP